MSRNLSLPGFCVLALVVLISDYPAAVHAVDASTVLCIPDRPAVRTGGTIRMRVWTEGKPLRYQWTVETGRLDGQGAEVGWDFVGVKAGLYEATVRVQNPSGNAAECSLQVRVVEDETSRDVRAARSFLQPNQPEGDGFGLYSYLFLASPPSTDATRERYLKALESYLSLILPIDVFGSVFDHSQLNITYVPIREPLPKTVAETDLPRWVLEHYDYVHALGLLRSLPGRHVGGPFIVSSFRPLSGVTTLSSTYLYQDLSISSVPPRLVSLWVDVFLNQAAQEHSWDEATAEKFVVRLRTAIGILGEGIGDIQNGLGAWIKLVR